MSGAFWAIAGRATAVLGVLLCYSIVTWGLGSDAASRFVYCESLAFLGAIIATVGLHFVVIRVLRNWESTKSSRSVYRLMFRVSVISGTAIGLVTAALIATTIGLKGVLPFDLAPYLVVVVVWMALLTINQLMAEFLRGFERFRESAWIGGQNSGVLTILITIALLSALAATGTLTLSRAFLVQVVALVISSLVGAFTLASVVKSRLVTNTDGDSDNAMCPTNESLSEQIEASYGWLIRESLPNLAIQLSTLGLLRAQNLMVGQFAQGDAVAIYGGIRRIVQLLGTPLLIVNATLPTFVVDLYEEKRLDRIQELLRGAATFCLLPTLVATLVLLIFPGEILYLLFGFTSGATALRWLAVANLAFVASGSCGLALRMTGRQFQLSLSAVLSAVLYLLIAPWAITRYGLDGAAVAAGAITIIRSLVATALVRTHLGIWVTPTMSMESLRRVFKALAGRKKGRQRKGDPCQQPQEA